VEEKEPFLSMPVDMLPNGEKYFGFDSLFLPKNIMLFAVYF